MPPQAATVSIRKAKGEDSSGILACLRQAFEEFREGYTPEAFLDTVLTPQTLRERLETMSVFVAVNCEEQVVGTIASSVVGLEVEGVKVPAGSLISQNGCSRAIPARL